ncbi:hypothetical protein LGK95_21275 [Clostridium algoriphilum]|uniref:hypothetical protein n=1 Tax=Clostridium algoriphilum TaxID=198347 RepID=UPI001CF0EFA9|nr:hypothetical protein [Clostridium algoriphilum]MCB2295988.1 hypothetical protein [Clostridium algoriphilum]
MNRNKLGKTKNSVNELDANKGSSGVADTQMAIMYKLSNMTSDVSDANLGNETKSNKK